MATGLDGLFYHQFFDSPEHKALYGTAILLAVC